MSSETSFVPRRVHLTRLMKIWRSAGWPCRDPVELDLRGSGCIAPVTDERTGHETLQLTPLGLQWLAEARRTQQTTLRLHDQLAARMARQLIGQGRIVWSELAVRARIAAGEEPPPVPEPGAALTPTPDHATLPDLWDDPHEPASPAALIAAESLGAYTATAPRPHTWRMARPDLYSIRNTSVAHYLHPVVHEIKASRADLLSDLRHAAKRESYQWLASECYYVFPAGIAEPEELPEAFGVWVLHGEVDDGRFELLRPARHTPCAPSFSVWMALAKATPLRLDVDESAQGELAPTADA